MANKGANNKIARGLTDLEPAGWNHKMNNTDHPINILLSKKS